MKRRVNKRGQFYFVSALIIVLIIVSFVVLDNYVTKRENPELKNIQEELDIEIQKTLEYSANNSLTDNEIQDLFTNFSENYITKIGKNKNIIFMFGKENGNLILKGNKASGSENLTIASGGSTEVISDEGEFNETIITSGSYVNVTTGANEYPFDLLEGQNFYYFITKEYKGEKQIIVG